MCICQNPDLRADYSLLQIPQSYTDIRDNLRVDNLSRGDNNSFLASQEYSSPLPNFYHKNESKNGRVSKLEMGLRLAMMLLLAFTSISMYQKQREIQVQTEKLHDSIKKVGDLNQRIEERRYMRNENKNCAKL